MSEKDEDKIMAIELWASHHVKDKNPPAIAIKYINDLLEYIEDMDLLRTQEDEQVRQDRYRAKIRKELEEELNMIHYRTEDGRVEMEIESAIHDGLFEREMEFEAGLYKEEKAMEYLKWIPAKFILKSLFKRLLWEEAE